jgi:hypothetical protein
MPTTRSRPRPHEARVTVPAQHAALVRFYVEHTLGGTVRTDFPGADMGRELVILVEAQHAARLAGFIDCVTLIEARR